MSDGRWRQSLRSGAAGTGPDHPLMGNVDTGRAGDIAAAILASPLQAEADHRWRHRWDQTSLKASDFGWPADWD